MATLEHVKKMAGSDSGKNPGQEQREKTLVCRKTDGGQGIHLKQDSNEV